ncbi:MAG: UDP-N-acetylglucosamine--N-acetylmuramyl-(pentapeptide) pyrophosphoryl-undecaprenol N-acetylglucosamine transferase [Anaerolineales bacterium]
MYPALAVVDALGERADVLWIGSEGGMAQRLVSRQGIRFAAIPAAGLHGVGWRALPRNTVQLIRGVGAARRLIRSFDPEAMLFTGGFVGVPAALAGWRRPSVTFVPDIEPALAQRLIGRSVDRICVTTDRSVDFYRQTSKVEVTGYPSRFARQRPERRDARKALGLSDAIRVLLVMGGSKGARSINRATWDALGELLPKMQVLHLTGDRDWPQVDSVVQSLPAEIADRYRPFPYLHEEMGSALAAADLVVSRAGASTLGEFPLFGLPSILVPYPHAWRYQQVNSEYLAGRGAAVVLADRDLSSDLTPMVIRLMESDEDRLAMGQAAGSLARPSAAGDIAASLVEVAKGKVAA